MPFQTATGEVLPLSLSWNGVHSCPDFLAIEGLSLGQSAHLSSCSCEFHSRLRSEDESEDRCMSTDFPLTRIPQPHQG